MGRSRNDNILYKVQQELSLILTHAGEGIYGLDLDGKTTFVNNAAARMVGLELGHLKGKCNHTLVHYKHEDGSEYPKDQCPIYATLQDGQPRHGDDEYFVRADGTLFPIEYFANPILSDGEVTGVVVTFIDITERKEKEALLYKYQHQLEKIVEEKTQKLVQANEKLKKLTLTDGLTGVANRRSFDKALSKEIRRSKRSNKPITLILGDIDFFKKYNDTYGHIEGDNCLQLVGQTLKKVFQRAGDFVARYGGEEFAVILTDTDASGAEHAAQKLLSHIQSLKIAHSCSEVSQYVSMSLGIVHTIPQSTKNESLIELADKALYNAKATGRNKYVMV